MKKRQRLKQRNNLSNYLHYTQRTKNNVCNIKLEQSLGMHLISSLNAIKRCRFATTLQCQEASLWRTFNNYHRSRLILEYTLFLDGNCRHEWKSCAYFRNNLIWWENSFILEFLNCVKKPNLNKTLINTPKSYSGENNLLYHLGKIFHIFWITIDIKIYYELS